MQYITFFLCLLATIASTTLAGEVKAVLIVKELFKFANITDGNAIACVKDASNAEKLFTDFGSDITNKDYDGALRDLNGALSSLSTAVTDCEVEGLKAKLDSLAAAVKFGKITIVDDAIEILIDATDMGGTL